MKWHELDRDGRLAAIREIYQPGMSAAEIASAIGANRNQVIGYYTRNPDIAKDCPFRNRKQRLNAKPMKPARRRIAVPPPPISQPLPTEHEPLHIDLMELTSTTCRWPRRSPDDTATTFCGCECDVTDPYCEHHMKAAINEGREKLL